MYRTTGQTAIKFGRRRAPALLSSVSIPEPLFSVFLGDRRNWSSCDRKSSSQAIISSSRRATLPLSISNTNDTNETTRFRLHFSNFSPLDESQWRLFPTQRFRRQFLEKIVVGRRSLHSTNFVGLSDKNDTKDAADVVDSSILTPTVEATDATISATTSEGNNDETSHTETDPPQQQKSATTLLGKTPESSSSSTTSEPEPPPVLDAAAKKKSMKQKYFQEKVAKEALEATAVSGTTVDPTTATDANVETVDTEKPMADASKEKNTKSTLEPVASVAPGNKKTTNNKASPDDSRVSPTSLEGGPPVDASGVRQYSTPELTADAARHKAGMSDPTRPDWQNPLHHNNEDITKMFREEFDSDEAFEAAQIPAPPIAMSPLPGEPARIAAPDHLHALADEMVHLTMLEMNELINRIADHYGFQEGMLNPEGDGGGGDAYDDNDGDDSGAASAAAAEKTTFDVKLVSYDAAMKIKIIKEVRVVVPGLGLKEAKELVEGAPVALQKGVSKEVAEQIKAKLEELGAVLEIV